FAVRKVAHRLDQIIVPLACEPRRRYAADQLLLMTGLAYRYCGRRRGERRVLRPFRPILGREISRCGRQLFLGEVYRDLLHDIAGALSVFESPGSRLPIGSVSGSIHNRRRGRRIAKSPRRARKKRREMIVEKAFPRRNRIVGGREPNPGGSLRLTKETLANIAALVALALM